MDIGDIVKIIFIMLMFVLPSVAKAAEDKKKKERQKRFQQRGQGGNDSGPAPRTGQSLSEWIEDVQRAAEAKRAKTDVFIDEVEEEPAKSWSAPEIRPPARSQDWDDVHPVEVKVEAHINPVEVDIAPHVDPIKPRFQAITSRFGSIDDIEPSLEDDSSGESVKRAKSAKRASRESGRSIRARRASSSGKASIKIRRGDLKRALIMKEILGEPLAFREENPPQ